jgi:AAA family ATP:ADP antiporter
MVALGFVGLAHLGIAGALMSCRRRFSAVQRSIIRPRARNVVHRGTREDKYKSKAFIDTFVYAPATW